MGPGGAELKYGRRSVFGIGAAALAVGETREGVAPSRLGGLGGHHWKNCDFRGLKRYILKASEDNFTAYSPAKILIFYDQFLF